MDESNNAQPEIETIPNFPKVQEVTYTPRFSAVCSIGKAPFWGELDITYQPKDKLLEFESFERWLKGQAGRETTVEGFCRLAFDVLREALGTIPLRVVVRAETTVHAAVSVVIAEGFGG
jgi:NADPH-dependent 7-cyano-7-deazaguanine reductase QueF